MYSNFKSFIPSKCKSNLLATLLYRIYHIISNNLDFLTEVDNIEKILLRNGYPIKFICICVKRFLKNKNRHKEKSDETSENKIMVIMMYLGKTSSKIECKMKCLFKKALPKVKIQFIYRTSYKMANLFQF